MSANYKQLCAKCKKNYVVVNWKTRYPICYDCQKSELSGKIKDPAMKKLFDIPEDLYRENNFLRSIKKNYLTYGRLTEKQIAAFKKAVEKISSKIPK